TSFMATALRFFQSSMPRFGHKPASKTSEVLRLPKFGLRPAKLIVEPGAGKSPLPLGGPLCQSQRLRGLLQAQDGEATQLDELGGRRILLVQTSQRLVQGDQLFVIGVERDGNLFQVDALAISAPFESLLVTSPVDQNPAHGLGGGGKEMPAA